jgi:hypothetical protein
VAQLGSATAERLFFMSAQLYALTAEMARQIRRVQTQVRILLGDTNPSGDGGNNSLERMALELMSDRLQPIADRNFQTVSISSVTLNADGTYNGHWVSNDTGTQSNEETVRVKQISSGALVTGQYYLAYYSHFDETNHVGVFLVPDSSATGATRAARYGIATTGFTAGTAGAAHSFTAQTCNKDGSSPSGSNITVYLTNLPYCYPNVETGDVLPIVWNDSKSEWECSVQDDPISTVKGLFAGLVPHGWHLLTDDYPNAQGRFLLVDSGAVGLYEGGDATDAYVAPDYSLTVYDGTEYTTGPGCWTYSLSCDTGFTSSNVAKVGGGSLNDIGVSVNTVKKCGTEEIPAFTIDDARPPWFSTRWIIRYDNKAA